MGSSKISFQNSEGHLLAARLELPADQHPHSFAIFAHCFTCNKNLSAVRNISRSLNQSGIGVLRFDFTGLGESEGDFADTNFSSNVEDLVFAAKFLEENYMAPNLVIGHSLGGAAAIFAASKIDSILAVATIGAPSDPAHVSHLLSSGIDTIEKEGVAEVQIGGRPFMIKKQFLEDLRSGSLSETVKNMRKPILVMHSPQDMTVEIENAANIYHAAHHPKSFISLDGADHLLSRAADSLYAGNVIANWVMRYIDTPEKDVLKSPDRVVVQLGKQDAFTTEIKAGKHQLIADEPESIGGNDFGPTPYDLLLSSLGACTAMTIKMYADRKQWDLQEVRVHLSHSKQHAEDISDVDGPAPLIDVIDRSIELEGNLDERQKARIMQIADKCPVHRTLHSDIIVNSKMHN